MTPSSQALDLAISTHSLLLAGNENAYMTRYYGADFGYQTFTYFAVVPRGIGMDGLGAVDPGFKRPTQH